MLFVTVLLLLACIMSGILSVSPYKGGGKEKKKSYDTFFDFEILVFSEMGANSAIFESGLTPIASLKLTLEGSKNF